MHPLYPRPSTVAAAKLRGKFVPPRAEQKQQGQQQVQEEEEEEQECGAE